MEFIEVKTTTPNSTDAEKLASVVLNLKLAACAQISGPIKSIYRWKGEIQNSEEYLCVFKTTQDRYIEIENVIKQNHSYETPEIYSVSFIGGSSEYLDWVREEVRK